MMATYECPGCRHHVDTFPGSLVCHRCPGRKSKTTLYNELMSDAAEQEALRDILPGSESGEAGTTS